MIRNKISIISLVLSLLVVGTPLFSEKNSTTDRFSYSGDILYRGYYLWRDLVVPNHSLSTGEQKTEQTWTEYHVCNLVPAKCTDQNQTKKREGEDFSTIRFRLNMAFRPSPYADILYAIEVGHLTFGRESSKSGPGAGGRGSGRVNLETRELLLRLHNISRELIGDIGIFNFSTPSGIVVATSGAGGRLKYDLEALRSSFQMYYIHSVDYSRVDGDSNGFADTNFADNKMAVFRWKASLPKYVKSDLYGVFRSDDDPTIDDPTESNLETSDIYWAGLYLDFQFGAFEIVFHAIGNWGHYTRLLDQDPQIKKILNNSSDPMNAYFTEATKAPLRKNYDINAGAGQVEVSWDFNDSMSIALVGAGATGRIPGDEEEDGSSIDFRSDQFRHAGASFSYTEIAVDDSGGYSIFKAGQLTGLNVAGLRYEWQLLPALSWKFSWYKIKAYRTPNLTKNENYLFYHDTNRASNDIGEEWNTQLEWKPFTDFTLTTKLARFNAGKGYKALYDITYGDDLYEFSIFLKQKF